MEIQPELELALRERDRVAYRLRSILKPFGIRAAYLNPKSACVELHLRSTAPPEFSPAILNFLIAHGFHPVSESPDLQATKIVNENDISAVIRVTFFADTPSEVSECQFIRVEGLSNVA